MGRRKKSPTDYHKLAVGRGFQWLGPEVKSVLIGTWWECDKGHKWQTRYATIYSGKGCPFCARCAPRKPVDYRILAKGRGFKWLGPRVQNVGTKTWWECQRAHQWEARYNDIGGGSGCPHCAGQARKTAEDYHNLAESRGFEWVGIKVFSVMKKTQWKCSEGHQWEACYDSIRRGNGCPYCANRVPKNENDYCVLAKERGIKWLDSESPRDTTRKTLWECQKGHQWEAPYNRIQQRHGCPVCGAVNRANSHRKKPADYHNLARKRGYRWLGSKVPSDTRLHTLWECAEGHHWKACYGNINQGYGCPSCVNMINGRNVSKIQQRLCKMVEGELNHWIGSYCIDITLPSDKIAIEYDSWYWHGNRLGSDAQRDKVLLEADWRVLHVRSNSQLPTMEQVDDALSRLRGNEKMVEIILDDWGKGNIFAGS